MWSVLCDERIGMSFKITPGPRQHSHFRVRVPWDSLPYFTVSDSSTRNLPGGKGRPARKADNLTATSELIV
jgi:hypothetical protein